MLTLTQAAEEMSEAQGAMQALLLEQGLDDLSEPSRAVFEEMRTRTTAVASALQSGDVEEVKELVPEAEEAVRCLKAALSAEAEAGEKYRDRVSEIHRILIDLRGQLTI